MGDMIDRVHRLINSLNLGSPVSIVGHSLGGIVAQGLVGQYPNEIDRMILVSTAVNVMIHPELMRQINAGAIEKDFVLGGLSESVPEDVKELILSDFALVRLRSGISDPMDISKVNYSSLLMKVKNKVLVLYGVNDKVVSPRRIKNMQHVLSNGVVKAIEDVGHYPHLEKPEVACLHINDFFRTKKVE